jgi:CBS domain-containing protein
MEGPGMDDAQHRILAFLETVHPYDSLPRDELARVAGSFSRREFPAGAEIYHAGEPLQGIYLVKQGAVEVLDPTGDLVSLLGPRNSFGERGLLRDGRAVTTARAVEASVLLLLPGSEFRRLISQTASFERFFNRGRSGETRGSDLTTRKVADLMAARPVTLAPHRSIREAAAAMRDAHVSSLGIVEGDRFLGIVTTRDMTHKVLAAGLDPASPVSQVMTADPVSLPPSALGSDILHLMLERRIGHLPVVEDGRLVGMVTQTDLTRFQAVSSASLVRDAATAETVAEMAAVTARIPQLLTQLVGGHNAHEVVTRLVTDVADTVTRRLLAMAEAQLGPPPVPYLWLACGSQGRQEQTGVTDQDNCLFLDDAATPDDMAYFHRLAAFVCDGLNACGYVYCPGEMMAMSPRWCQPMRVWRDYFSGWINRPDPMAQMLSSVMFDLRPIGGTTRLFHDFQTATLEMASRNSIFVAHMISNSLKHQPPLGLLRGLATIRSGEFKNHVDLKHNGVVPVVDLGRIYALTGRLTPANTRARLEAAEEAGVISASGGRDLIGAYDMIARIRLENQASQIRAGRKPDNFLAPSDLSDFERSHLRDAFVVVRTMQSALGHARGAAT